MVFLFSRKKRNSMRCKKSVEMAKSMGKKPKRRCKINTSRFQNGLLRIRNLHGCYCELERIHQGTNPVAVGASDLGG